MINYIKNIFSFNKKTKIGFDKVYCISFCRNIEKQNNIRKLMNYLGIDFDFIYGADFSNFKILKHEDFYFPGGAPTSYKFENFKYYTHFIAASYDHYTAIIHAYESGSNSVLILEDDCVFINNVKYLKYCLNNYPKDADIIKFGYHNWNDIKQNRNINIQTNNKYILDSPNIHFSGSQFYGLCNRDIMKKYIEYQSKNFKCCDAIFSTIPNLKCYCLVKPLAIDGYTINYTPEDIEKYNLINLIK